MNLKEYDPTLTDDDLKVVKHLDAINRLFKKGNLSIRQLFVDNGTLAVTKVYDSIEYEIKSFKNIMCDGGDPDRSGEFSIREQLEWMCRNDSEND
jgi:hypothetical protein